MPAQMALIGRRRAAVAGAGAAALGLGGPHRVTAQEEPAGPPARTPGAGAAFVLVHGGWHGGWCWRDVAARLRAAGHQVWAPTLTGLGERAHLLTPEVDLALHVQDLLGVLEFEDLRDAILVGHSYAGMVATGAAGRAAGRLAHLVYLDAFVPEDGQSLFDLLPPERRAMYRQQAQERGDGWRVPAPPPEALGVTDPAQARWLAQRLTPQPLLTLEQPLRLDGPAPDALPRTYVHCTFGPTAPSFAPFAARAGAAGSGWRFHQLATGHDAMLTTPEDVTALLLELV
jgi:pimeloyl-ACP methyl ester carboxylesterase